MTNRQTIIIILHLNSASIILKRYLEDYLQILPIKSRKQTKILSIITVISQFFYAINRKIGNF